MEEEGGSTSIPFCKICLEEDIEQNFITPCRCSGSAQHTHKVCLDNWRGRFSPTHINSTTCRECLVPFNYPCKTRRGQRRKPCDCRKFVMTTTYITNVMCLLAFLSMSFGDPIRLESIAPVYILNTGSAGYATNRMYSNASVCWNITTVFLTIFNIILIGFLCTVLDLTNTSLMVITVCIGAVTVKKLSRNIQQYPNNNWVELQDEESDGSDDEA